MYGIGHAGENILIQIIDRRFLIEGKRERGDRGGVL